MEKFLLRMPAALKGRLAEEATASGKSLNALIVERLDAPVAAAPEQTSLDDEIVVVHSGTGKRAFADSGKRSYDPDPK